MNFFTPFTMPTGASIPEREVNIRDFGAQPGGEVLNTEAIAAAIEAVAQEGGGRVIFPAGCWLTGPIHLKSGVELHLEKDCEVRFSQKKELYLPPVYTLYEGVRCYTYSAMLYAYQCHDIAVTGEGTFNGQGHAWWYMSCVRTGVKDLYDAGEKHRPVETRVYQREEDGIRPGLLHFLDCKNVRIEGVTFTFSPFWTVHPTWCENIIVRNVTVRNPYMYAPNTDGVNLEGCRRGLVDGVFADTGDDAVCIKSGRDEDGRTVARPCEDIVVRNCRANRSHGGITIGSETSGGVRNILVEDCEFLNNCIGIWIKTSHERGGVMENMEFRNIRTGTVSHQGICITMGYYVDGNTEAEFPHMPTVRNIEIENFTCRSAPLGIQIDGVPGHPIREVHLKNMQIGAKKGMTTEHVERLYLENVSFV